MINSQQIQQAIQRFGGQSGAGPLPTQPSGSPALSAAANTSPTVAASLVTNNPTQTGSSTDPVMNTISQIASGSIQSPDGSGTSTAAPAADQGFFARVGSDLKTRWQNIVAGASASQKANNDADAAAFSNIEPGTTTDAANTSPEKAAQLAKQIKSTQKSDNINDDVRTAEFAIGGTGQAAATFSDVLGEAIKSTGITKAIGNIKVTNPNTGVTSTLSEAIATDPAIQGAATKISKAWDSFQKMDPADAAALGGFGNIAGSILAADGVVATGEGLVSGVKDFSAGFQNPELTRAPGLAGGAGSGIPNNSFATRAGKFASELADNGKTAVAPSASAEPEQSLLDKIKGKFASPGSVAKRIASQMQPGDTTIQDAAAEADRFRGTNNNGIAETGSVLPSEKIISQNIDDIHDTNPLQPKFDAQSTIRNSALDALEGKNMSAEPFKQAMAKTADLLKAPITAAEGASTTLKKFGKALQQFISSDSSVEGESVSGGRIKAEVVQNPDGTYRSITPAEKAAGVGNFREPSIKDVHEFINQWGKVAYSKDPAASYIRDIIYGKDFNGGLSEELKKSTDAFESSNEPGVGSPSYRNSQAEISRLSDAQSEFKNSDIKKGLTTGKYTPADIEAFANKTLQGKLANFEAETGLPLTDRVTISKLFDIAAGQGNKATAFQGIRFSPNLTSMLVRNGISLSDSILKNPQSLLAALKPLIPK